MKAAILYGPRDLRIEEVELDTTNLGPTQIWVQTKISALKIGTDRGNYEGAEQVPGAPDFPRGVGDSNLGIVRGIGSEVSRFAVGDRVVSRHYHQSDYVADESEVIVKVPEGVHDEDAVFAHLYTLSGLCYHRAQFVPGENVAVVGLGVLGLGAVALGPLYGARVVGLGNSPVRLEMAKRMGAHAAFLSDDPDLEAKLYDFTNGNGIDIVILTANPWPAFRTSMEVVRVNGRISVVSLPGRGEEALDFNPLDLKWFYQKGLSIIHACGEANQLYPNQNKNTFDWERMTDHTLSLMVDGRLEPKCLVTHHFHYSDMVEAYEMTYHREKNMLNVIFQWQE